MRYGFVLPGGTAMQQIEQAVLAEESGWDGIFVWEINYGLDPWSLLAAMAQQTTRLKLGTMLTPLPWRRPWKVASQVVTLDQVSGGRAILAVGLGAADDALGDTGEETDLRTRAELLDEGIDLIAGLWTGKLRFEGRHYQVNLEVRDDLAASSMPIQRPRPPIWVVGAWPRPKSMERVLRCDGLIPQAMNDGGAREIQPSDIREIIGWLRERDRSVDGFDIIMAGETPADDPSAATAAVQPWAEAGCTWWLETAWGDLTVSSERMQQVQHRLSAGPPSAE